jgi:hypothetical protein
MKANNDASQKLNAMKLYKDTLKFTPEQEEAINSDINPLSAEWYRTIME